jgi:hypothetical protein
VHWDGLYQPFKSGPAKPYDDPEVAALLEAQGVRNIVPGQYMDKWRLDKDGIRGVNNTKIKQKLGFH